MGRRHRLRPSINSTLSFCPHFLDTICHYAISIISGRCTALQSQKAVTAYLKLLPISFARQHRYLIMWHAVFRADERAYVYYMPPYAGVIIFRHPQQI